MDKLQQRKEFAFPVPPKHRTTTGVEMILVLSSFWQAHIHLHSEPLVMQMCCSLCPLAACACRGRTCITELRGSLQQSALGCIAVPCNFITQYSLLKLLCGTMWAYTNSSSAVWLRYWFDAIITALLLRELSRFYNECNISVVKHISSCNYSSHYITSKSRSSLKKIMCCIMKKNVI